MGTARILASWLLGRSTVEYWEYHKLERDYYDRRREADDEANGTAKWIAADPDWPARHMKDVNDREAADLIWRKDFTSAAGNVAENLRHQPLYGTDPESAQSPSARRHAAREWLRRLRFRS